MTDGPGPDAGAPEAAMGDEEQWQLLERLKPAAKAASDNAHAPYSRLHVGAALLTSDQSIYAACNVESASYGLTQCAERNALGTAIAAGVPPGTVHAMVIYLPGNTPIPPCGACRQVMAELMRPGSPVLTCCDSAAVQAWTIDQLLPGAYQGPED